MISSWTAARASTGSKWQSRRSLNTGQVRLKYLDITAAAAPDSLARAAATRKPAWWGKGANKSSTSPSHSWVVVGSDPSKIGIASRSAVQEGLVVPSGGEDILNSC